MATHADISGNLVIGPGQSVRRDAGGSVFEAYTPVAGSVGAGTAGYIAEWAGTTQLQAASLIKSGTGVMTLNSDNAVNIIANSGFQFESVGGDYTNFIFPDNGNAEETIAVMSPAGGFSATSLTGGTVYALSTTSTTNAVITLLLVKLTTASGTPAAGFGVRESFQLKSSTTNSQDAAAIEAVWNDATHATRKADIVISAYDTAQREGVRIRGNGSAPAIGLYGATPVARATTSGSAATFTANSGSAVNDASTFDGYTIGQIVKALRDIGVLT